MEEFAANDFTAQEIASDDVLAENLDAAVQEALEEIIGEAVAEDLAEEKSRKRKETLGKIGGFLIDHKDTLILGGQLALVTIVCVAGIKADLNFDTKGKKKKRKKKK